MESNWKPTASIEVKIGIDLGMRYSGNMYTAINTINPDVMNLRRVEKNSSKVKLELFQNTFKSAKVIR